MTCLFDTIMDDLLGYDGWSLVFDHLQPKDVSKSKMWLVSKSMAGMVSSWFRRWTSKWGPRLDDAFYIPKTNELRFDLVERRWVVNLSDLDPVFDDWMDVVRIPAARGLSKKQIKTAKMKSIREAARGQHITINTDGLDMDPAVNHVLRVAPIYKRGLLATELSRWKGNRAIVVKRYETLLGHMRRIWNEGKANAGRRSWLLLWRFLIWGF
jgi:hypothetical protein